MAFSRERKRAGRDGEPGLRCAPEAGRLFRVRIRLVVLVTAATASLAAFDSSAEEAGGERLARRFEAFVVIDRSENVERIAYADARGHIHAYRYEGGLPALEWENTTLGSAVSSLMVTDVDTDGSLEIVIATTAGRVLFYDSRTFEPEWENRQEPFGDIRCAVAGNVDEDPQQELILATTSRLICLDGSSKLVEWETDGFPGVSDMALGDTDEDGQLELVLNSGVVYDTRHLRIEFESPEPFGVRIDLIDLTGDGVPEVVGEGRDSTLRVFDVRRARELW